MSTKNRKTFELSAIKKYKRYERMLWLIPAVWAILAFKPFVVDNLKFASRDGVIPVYIFIYYLAGVAVLSAFPFFIGKIVIRTRIKAAIQNCTITSMQDFDYYRDKLTGLSPAEISILTDLEIEQKKDVAASILQYENLGLLVRESDGTYHTTPKYDTYSSLRESDRYLIEHLIKGDLNWENDTQWRQLVMDEAISEGYVTKAEWLRINRQKQEREEAPPSKRSVAFKRRAVKLLLGAGWLCWAWNAAPRIMQLEAIFGATYANKAELAEKIRFMYSQPGMLFAIVEEIALFIAAILILCYKPRQSPKEGTHHFHKENLILPGLWLVWLIWMVLTLPDFLIFDPDTIEQTEELFLHSGQMHLFIVVMPFLIYTAFLVTLSFLAPYLIGILLKNRKPVKRTDYGNQMAECVYGMKNFIHDYSNLSEADRRQVVLWEDYLVYAVVLEENEEIVKEISKTRGEIL